ncbi:hyaluronidase-1 [Engraulis encrasicolus]|uniref:hyaluronidase-1 n=1 Tax=Engraulis encrasicolus TaxID=184585 RepID=UPI002FD59913
MLPLLCLACLLGQLPACPAASVRTAAAGGPRRVLPSINELPFMTVWNAPTALCESRFGVDLDLTVFDIVANHDQVFMGDNITIFYERQLGLYPHYTPLGASVNGGCPQNASLDDHLWKVDSDLRALMPEREFRGLAVVDWESWRPLWERNWDSKSVYWEASRVMVKERHPDWPPERVEWEARDLFECAAKAFMEDTLKLVTRERPGGLWGFYGFPCCYNYQYKDLTKNYTGECPTAELKRNEDLLWLWNVSRALYPDIYLDLSLRGRDKELTLYARHRIQEAFRVQKLATTPILPLVVPYARIAYTYSLEFLSEEDLIHTVGESAALGSAGVVLWGDATYSESKVSCDTVRSYVDETLGRYIVNVTTATDMCSRTLCHGNGRCQRKDPMSGAYLHLDPTVWSILPRAQHGGKMHAQGPAFKAQRKPGVTQDNLKSQLSPFKCQCHPGWMGVHCNVRILPTAGY